MPAFGGPPTKWGIARPWTYGAIFGILTCGSFLVVSAANGQLGVKALAIGVGMGIVALLLAGLIAASYRGDVSQGS